MTEKKSKPKKKDVLEKTETKNSKIKKEEPIQPEITIGLCGHVDHGKTTLLEKLSGKWADTHSEEVKRGITIRLGYADSTFYKTKDAKYTSKKEKDAKFLRKVSFVDAPGHESLMATMLSGAAIMDGALVMVAANEKCPQPQTIEHLMALDILGVKNIIIVQNKIDLVDEKQALENYKEIKDFLNTTNYKDAPIIPISAQHNINIDMLIETIETTLKTPEQNLDLDPVMFVARSFDINKPGSKLKDWVGGILGGILKQGKLKKGDEIEIKPGLEYIEKNQKIWKPLKTKIVGIVSGGSKINEIKPGGSMALLTSLDPSIVKSDSLTGSIVGIPGKLPPTLYDITIDVSLLKRVVGAKQELDVDNLKPNEVLMLNVNSSATVGVVTNINKNIIILKLKRPVCAEKGSRITISRLIEHRFRLIGFGIIK
jgi:translation initiation factor 2 subunit 3